MKTSVVLLALAAAALAAPALHEETIDEPKIPARFLDAFTRERKSTLEQAPGTPVNLPSQVSEIGVTGRSFNLKKPIIIKKKVGSSYQVYRDSDEEKLDSPVPCRKQVRVSLCDEQSLAKTDMMKSATNEDPSIEMTEEDMKHSIMLAKQAVENIQMDLKKVEEPTHVAPWNHGESDAELHEDIESARLALEHIHNTFDDSEASKLHGSSMKSAEIVEDVTIPLAHTEEERLAQWKDAIQNIQRNVELVKNIEDSFKSTNDDMAHTSEAAISKNDDHKHSHEQTHDMRVPEEGKQTMEHMEHSTLTNLEHPKLEKASEQNEMITDKVEKDMLESASMVSASKIQDLSHNDKERLSLKQDFTVKAKEAIGVDAVKLDHTIQHPDSMKMAKSEEPEAEKTKEDKLEDPMMKKITSAEKEDLLDKQRHTDKDVHDSSTHTQFKHEEPAITQSNEMKSAELFNEQHTELIKDEDKTHDQHHIMEKLRDATSFTKEHNAEVQFHGEEKMVKNKNSMLPVATSEPMTLVPHKMIEHNLEMKEADHMNNKHHQLHEQHHMRWAGDKDMNTETGLMKSADETRQMGPSMQMHPGHHHGHQHAHQHMSSHHMDHDHLMHHDQFMAHSRSANMDNSMQPNFYMNMRDSEQDGQRFRWRPSHMPEAARSAYGAPAPVAAPSSGAIGLFPNAKVGGCGIPLLLSCNPSVVSGSLAKAPPASYSAPAYRTEDDFNFHHKRETKKTNPLKSTVLVAKQ